MTVFEFHLTYMINICSTFLEQTYMDLVQKKKCPYHSWYGSTLHIFLFQVRPLILLSSLLYGAVYFVKGLTKIDHGHTGIYKTKN